MARPVLLFISNALEASVVLSASLVKKEPTSLIMVMAFANLA